MRELHFLEICPFSRTILLLINELNLGCDFISENNLHNINQKSFFNKDGKKYYFDFPCLVENDVKIIGRQAISEYIFENNTKYRDYLLGDSVEKRANVRFLVDWLENDFYVHIVRVVLYEKVLRNFDMMANRSPDSNALRNAESMIKKYLFRLQSMLEKSEYLAGEFITLADFVLAANISILDYFDLISWDLIFKRLKYWYLIIKSRPNFRSIIKMKFFGFKQSRQYALIDF